MGRILSLTGCFGHVAWADETPIGFVLARDLDGECEILSLGVTPAMRRRGTGARLLRAACDDARRRGSASVVLEVATDNRAARKLYGSLGFVRVGHRPRYYRRPGGVADALILRLSLSDATTSH
jgi:ribosomal-protein-alanine N-acetyltransferase